MDKSHNWTEDSILDEDGAANLGIEAIRLEVEEAAARAYKMGKANKEVRGQDRAGLLGIADHCKQLYPPLSQAPVAGPAVCAKPHKPSTPAVACFSFCFIRACEHHPDTAQPGPWTTLSHTAGCCLFSKTAPTTSSTDHDPEPFATISPLFWA